MTDFEIHLVAVTPVSTESSLEYMKDKKYFARRLLQIPLQYIPFSVSSSVMGVAMTTKHTRKESPPPKSNNSLKRNNAIRWTTQMYI